MMVTETKLRRTNDTKNIITHAFTIMSSTWYTAEVIFDMGANAIIM
jgi:hypothetical protein